MRVFTFVAILFVALCSVGVTDASMYGVDCECLCCTPNPSGPCDPTDVGFVHLDSSVCDKNQCIDRCAQLFFTCDDDRGTLDALCTDSPEPLTTPSPSSITTSTTRTSPSTVTWTEPLENTTLTSTTASPMTVTTTTSTPFSSTRSNGNVIMAMFPFSHFMLFACVLGFLRV